MESRATFDGSTGKTGNDTGIPIFPTNRKAFA